MNPQRRLSVSAVVGAMGIVYGDIGTSPLYALESALDAAGGFDAEAVLGVLSLVFWSLTISVTLKYVTVIMRADNEGEGGILALFAYQRHGTASVARLFGPVMLLWFVVIGVIGVIPIVRSPRILLALNPLHGIDLLVHRAPVALAIIGAVFLAITGGEALYAD